ncbi:MAG TPA: tripartite tricarboxylate transporter substrate-binding protein [Anaerolineae bacterium]|nr:tripartite tricarboxylate transporter substrate-binding protein [Anaerolineae bacterium]
MRATPQRIIVLLALLALVSAVPLGCAASTPVPAATQAPAPTSAPAETQAPAPTAVPATTAEPATSAAAAFYKDQILTILVTSPAGSTNDIYARLIAPYLEELTGVKIVVENKTAGGGLVAQNDFYRIAKPDGLTVMFEATGRLWPGYLMQQKGIEYDITKFQYMAGIKGGPYVLGVSPTGQYTTVDLLKNGKNLKVPTSTATSIISLAAMGATEALKLDAKLVIGVASDAAYLALQQGEGHFMVRAFDSVIRYEAQGQFKPLAQLGEKRDSLAPDVPTIGELTTLTADQKNLLGVLFPEAKVFMAPPGTPQDRVQFLDESITKILDNTEFQNKMKDQFGIWFGAYTAKESQDQISYLSNNMDEFKLYSSLIEKYVQ